MLTNYVQQQADATVKSFVDYLAAYFAREDSLSQREIARRANISYVFLNKILHKKATPSLPIAERIAAATGSSLSAILRNSKRVALAS